MQLCTGASAAAGPADVSPLKSFSRKKLHDSPKAVSRPSSGAAAASLPSEDHLLSSRWTSGAAAAEASVGSSTCGTCDPAGADDAGRQQYDQRPATAHQVPTADVEQPSSYELCDLLTAAAPVPSVPEAAAACQAMPVTNGDCSNSESSSRAAPPPALTLPDIQEQQQHMYSQHQQQHWIPRAMPAQLSPAAAAAGRMLMQPCMAAAQAGCSSALSPPAKVAGVRAAAALLGSGDCSPECLSPVVSTAAATSSHAAALEAALWASRLH
jgi:hypothetical protein